MKLLKLFLTYQLKSSQSPHKTRGFTLIELLVGLLLAFLIIAPLLGFLVNTMTTDRQEQAKANSEQETQTALGYIARDLDQAIFVYDGWGLSANTQVVQNLPYVDAKHTPVLVFWKRYHYPKAIPTNNANCATQPDNCNDAFAFSLVAYYLIDNSDCSNTKWSCTAQIGRVELKDGVRLGGNYLPDYQPNQGFVLFPTDAQGSIEDQMNAWPGTTPPAYGANTPKIEILLDYIDQTKIDQLQTQQEKDDLKASCPTTVRDVPRPDVPNPPPGYIPTNYTYRQVPFNNDPTQIRSSFYACVNGESTAAQVFIRGNALARLTPRTQAQTPKYTTGRSSYFPQANIRVKGGGLLTNNNQS
jgi:type II secretory pathway component PulJ